jgi:hypothetical protein
MIVSLKTLVVKLVSWRNSMINCSLSCIHGRNPCWVLCSPIGHFCQSRMNCTTLSTWIWTHNGGWDSVAIDSQSIDSHWCSRICNRVLIHNTNTYTKHHYLICFHYTTTLLFFCKESSLLITQKSYSTLLKANHDTVPYTGNQSRHGTTLHVWTLLKANHDTVPWMINAEGDICSTQTGNRSHHTTPHVA